MLRNLRVVHADPKNSQLLRERGPRFRKRTVATRGAAFTGKIHRFREKADSKKNISRSNSPTANYSGLVFSFFGVSFSVHLAIHLMLAFRSIETSTPAFQSCRIKEVYIVVEGKVTDSTGESQSVVAQLRFCRPRVLKRLSK